MLVSVADSLSWPPSMMPLISNVAIADDGVFRRFCHSVVVAKLEDP
jgi:hypothetical protein